MAQPKVSMTPGAKRIMQKASKADKKAANIAAKGMKREANARNPHKRK